MRHRRTTAFILAIIALISGLATGRAILFNLAYLLGLLIITSFAWAWINLNWVKLSRNTRTRRTQVGRPLEERFTVYNTSIIPKLWLEVHDFGNVPGHYSSHVLHNLGGRSAYTWRINTICTERGRYQLGPIRLRTSDPFGLFPMERDFTATTHVVVYPLTFDIHQLRHHQRCRRTRLCAWRQFRPYSLAQHGPPRPAHCQRIRAGSIGRHLDCARHGHFWARGP